MFIDYENVGRITPRVLPDYIELYASTMAVRFFVNSNDSYTGEINKITYTISRRDNNQSASYIDGGNDSALGEFYDDYVTLQKGNPSGIKVSADSAMPYEGTMLLYDV